MGGGGLRYRSMFFLSGQRQIFSFRRFLLAGMAGLAFFPVTASAQQSGRAALPSFAFPRDDIRERTAKENWTLAPVPAPALENSYLRDILSLQDQINLIEKLSEREKVLSELGETYRDMGIAFTPPPPPRDICEKIPPSVVCVQAYPDLFKIAMPVEDPVEDVGTQPPPLPVEQGKPRDPPVALPEEAGPVYRWTDVTCAGGACRAVLVNQDDARARRTVSEGDTLGGGVVVSKISFEGVRVSRNGTDMALMPAVAPSRGGSASPLFASEQMALRGQTRRLSGPASSGSMPRRSGGAPESEN